MLWLPQSVPSPQLDQIIASASLKGGHIGVCVTDGQGTVLYERLSDQRFIPASNQKLFSVLYALDTLGPYTTLKTRIWKSAGRLDVLGVSDPTLELAHFWKARKDLGVSGHCAVHVHVPFQTTLGPGWQWDDLPWYYAAPTSALSVQHTAFEVWAEKGKLEPLPRELKVKVVRLSKSKGLKVRFDPAKNVLTITGKLPVKRERLGSFAQTAPVSVVARALGGEVVLDDGAVPSRAPDAVIVGKPIALAAKQCLEESDNMAAEQLLTATAFLNDKAEGSPYPGATNRMRDFFTRQVGIGTDEFVPADGCGLSRHNYVTPRSICRALDWALTRPYAEHWLEALAAGGEGTLKSRLKDSSFIGKTGTMNAVVSLSGYVKTRTGETLTVSLLFNNVQAPNSEIRSVQDRFVKVLEQGTVRNGRINSQLQ